MYMVHIVQKTWNHLKLQIYRIAFASGNTGEHHEIGFRCHLGKVPLPQASAAVGYITGGATRVGFVRLQKHGLGKQGGHEGNSRESGDRIDHGVAGQVSPPCPP